MITIRPLVSTAHCPTDDINRLLSELSSSSSQKPATESELLGLIGNPHFHFFLATEQKLGAERCAGMATIFFQRVASRWVAEIHDVVVDKQFRRRGVGELLLDRLLAEAERYANNFKEKIKVDLTSKPDRIAANKMYKKAGFTLIATATKGGTNLYRKIMTPT